MKKLMILAAALLLTAGCGPKKVNLEFGSIVPTQEGFLLPILREPGSKRVDYTVELAFADNSAVLYSKKEMHSCFITFAYTVPGTEQKDLSTLDLDFHDRVDGLWVYRVPYTLFPAKAILDNVFQTAVYYAPQNVGLPQKDITAEDGSHLLYPDYKGYYFIFNGDETKTWFKPVLDHVQ